MIEKLISAVPKLVMIHLKNIIINQRLDKLLIVKKAIRYYKRIKNPPQSHAEIEYRLNNVDDLIKNRKNDGMKDYPSTRPHLAFNYLSGLVQWLAESDYKVMSYNELGSIPKFGEEGIEFNRWIAKANEEKIKAILLQYDVDANPDITSHIIDTHIKYKVPSNIMVFNRKIFDWKLKREGIVEYDDNYILPFKKFEEFQKYGGVIGYHCNAFDRAAGNERLALEIFEKDVIELRKHLDIRFFSMHGGHVTKEGRSNASMNVGSLLAKLNLTWVHNGHSVYFHRNWADGSASNPRYRNEPGDPLDFILSTNIGERTRLLFHPQYYHELENKQFHFPILHDSEWVQQTQNFFQGEKIGGNIYWKRRYTKAKRDIALFDQLYESSREERPVFINGLSRSGTTLLASMFDAHPQGAMAYESYPRYLHEPSGEGVLTREHFIYVYQCLINYPEAEAFALLNKDPLRNIRKFVAVSSWTGMTTAEVGQLIRSFVTKHGVINNAQDALKVVAASARFKFNKGNNEFWGTKCQGNFPEYLALWPNARFIRIMRNGLDILASQKTNGAFNPDPSDVGTRWRQNYQNFQNFKQKYPTANCASIKYENLVSFSETTMRQLCEAIKLPYHNQMIHQYQVKNTLVENPRGQLSVDRIQQPIDTSAIDRWKTQLSEAEVAAFLKGCGGLEFFELQGYSSIR